MRSGACTSRSNNLAQVFRQLVRDEKADRPIHNINLLNQEYLLCDFHRNVYTIINNPNLRSGVCTSRSINLAQVFRQLVKD